MAESLNDVWIPAFATAHVVGIALFFYALEQTNGALTYWTWHLKYMLIYKKKFNGDFKIAWYYTYPGAKEAYDAQQAELNGTEKGLKGDVEAGKDGDSGREYSMPMELTWKDVSYRVKVGKPPKPKTVLHKCSGNFKPCEATALMGPSGAGKSTLLDILAGRKMGKGVGGEVLLNDEPLTQKTASQYTAYVCQEDTFVATISVLEALTFYAQLSLPGEVDKAERKARVDRVLDTMGLTRVKHSKVGGLLPGGVSVRGISGGEKRRLSVACGLVANPSVLFLDEPTTGLDSHAALAVMNHLVDLTRYGLTVVASIHQPRQEIFESFDKVLILSEGYQLFFAPPSYCLHWFKNVLGFPYNVDVDGTVADWLIGLVSITFYKDKQAAARSLATVEEVKEAAHQFSILQDEADNEAHERLPGILESAASGAAYGQDQFTWIMNSWALASNNNLLTTKERDAQTSMLTGGQLSTIMDTMGGLPDEEEHAFPQRQYPRSWLVQYSVLFKRTFLSTLRNPAECAVRLLMVTWVTMCAGLVYIRLPDNGKGASPRMSTLYFATMLFLMNPFSYMSFFLSDRRFFVMDSANGLYAPSAYHVATVTASAPFVILNTCVGTLTLYGLSGLRNEWQAILIAMAIMSLHALTAQQFAIWAVWFTKSQDAAFTITSSYVSMSLLLCGFYIRVKDMPLSFIKGLTWATFSKYTLQGLAHNEFQDRDWSRTTSTCSTQTPLPLTGGVYPQCDTEGDAVLSYYGFGLSITQSSLALLGFYGLFNIMAYLALLKMYRARK